MADIRLKRVYDPISDQDGFRVLVERLWPRGFSKEAARLDAWMKEIAPSPQLRAWYGHQPDRWREFRERYLAELEQPDRKTLLAELASRAARGRVTLLFASRDAERCSAAIVTELLTR